MSSIVERLTEGVVNRDMRAESHALLTKWKKTGLLEGIETERQQNSMARLLENQAKELLRESTSMASGDVEGFAAVAFPIVRRVFAGLIANDLVSVQPMSLPSGLIFFLDFTFSSDLGEGTASGDGRMGNTYGSSIYGTDKVGSGVIDGVSLVDSRAGDLAGPRTSARGYAYASPTGSSVVTASAGATGAGFAVSGFEIGAGTDAQNKSIQYDADILALSSSTAGPYVLKIEVPKVTTGWETAGEWTNLDYDNLAAVSASLDDLTDLIDVACTSANTSQIRRLSRRNSADTAVDLFFVTSEDVTSVAFETDAAADLALKYPIVDAFRAGANTDLGAVRGNTPWGLEGNADIPEIDIKVDSIAVTAQTKKLKAKWTPELGQDLNAYHNLDAEVELTSLLSEQIALEIDREILADLVNGATAATRYWSRAPGLFVDSNGVEIGANTKAPDFTGTVSEWYETLVETINDVSAQIHRKTLRGGANFVVCGPEVANILEFTAGFRASVTHDDEKGSIGALRVGSLSKKFDVIVDPYFLRNVILVGRRGGSFLESGYVYAPYVPLQTTPTIFGPEDFVPRKGVMTRYAKKMVRPDMYGLVVVRGLLGESGA
jgi:hypothetical protein